MAGLTGQSAVVLFTDVLHFSRLVRKHPDRIGEIVDSYYRAMGDLIVPASGRIIKYIGDAILAIFPEGGELAATRCAFAMRPEFARLIREIDHESEAELEVALNAGRVISGTIGHDSYRSFDVFGEVVNETAMLMHHRGVAVTDALYQRIKSDVSAVALPPVTLKWRNEPLRAWEVLAV